jgi:invasion protein IalB
MSIPSRVAFCLLAFLPQTVWAQTKPAQPKPAQATSPKPPAATPAANPPAPGTAQNPAPGPESQITTTIYGDWALRCQKDNHANCEVSLTIQQKNQDAPIAKIAIGRPPGSGTQLLVLLPNNISFPSSVQIRSDTKDISGLDIPWQRCIPGACLAQTTLTDADLVRWHALDNAGRITFKDAQANEIGIEFSFHGLGQALDALTKSSQ